MIDKDMFIDFLRSNFLSNEIRIQHFDAGCSMVDVYLNEKDLLCVLLESSQIGISKIENHADFFDLSTISDNVFYSNIDAESFILQTF